MNHYEAKQEARRQRLLDLASKYEREGNARHARARALASVIPFGQPILVGHHSEGRDRRYRARIHQNFSKAFEASERAKELAAKAAAVGSGGVSSDDPDAPDKLLEKVLKLEALQVRMKAVNAAIRKHAKAGPIMQITALGALGISGPQAQALLRPDFAGRIGFACYQIQNNNANIRRIRQRIEHLQALAKTMDQESETVDVGPYQVVKNHQANRLQLIFPGKPPEAVRDLLKRNGFRWAPTEGAWQRMLSNSMAQFVTEGYLKVALEQLLKPAVDSVMEETA